MMLFTVLVSLTHLLFNQPIKRKKERKKRTIFLFTTLFSGNLISIFLFSYNP